MNHETARELLPWLLNGTLESDERNALRIHLTDCEECRRELEETRQALVTFVQHVPPEDLIAHAEGRETELPREVVDAHLESCPECAEELTLLVGSLHTYDQAQEALGTPGAPTPHRPATVPVVWRHGALAAALLAIVFFAGWLATWLSLGTPGMQMADISPGQNLVINVPTVDLYPGDLVLRGAEGSRPQIGEGAPALLSLNSNFSATDAPFTLEVVGEDDDQVLKRQEDLPYPPLGVFTVTRLEDHVGPLEIRIESAEGDVETYHFRSLDGLDS